MFKNFHIFELLMYKNSDIRNTDIRIFDILKIPILEFLMYQNSDILQIPRYQNFQCNGILT